jgi:hypothetical protein
MVRHSGGGVNRAVETFFAISELFWRLTAISPRVRLAEAQSTCGRLRFFCGILGASEYQRVSGRGVLRTVRRVAGALGVR